MPNKFELDEKKEKEKLPVGSGTVKKPRRTTVKNASFFLYEKGENDSLVPIHSSETDAGIRRAYEDALDQDIPEDKLVIFKGRFMEVQITEKKRRIVVR